MHPSFTEGLNALGYQCDERPGLLQHDVKECLHQYTGVVVATRIAIGKEEIEHAGDLKFIARAGSGMENIAVDCAIAKGRRCAS